MLFPVIALVLCVAVLVFDCWCAATATNPVPFLVLFATIPAVAGILLALGGVACAFWWPPGAFWLALAACPVGAGPTLLLFSRALG